MCVPRDVYFTTVTVFGPSFNLIFVCSPQSTNCTVINSTATSCVTPPLTRMQSTDSDGVNYTIRADNAPGPDLTLMSLQISWLPADT